MKKENVFQLLAALGVLLGVLSWQFVYKSYVEKTETVEAENEELQQVVNRLEILDAKKDQYIADTERMNREVQDIINEFPAGVQVEDMIMYLYNMELVDANDVSVSAVNMGTEVPVIYPGSTSFDGYEATDDGIGMITRQSTVTFTTTNNGLKNVLNYVYGISTRKSVSNVNLTVTDMGYLQGTMLLDFYYLYGVEQPYVVTDIFGVPTGTDNFFGARNGSAVQETNDAEEEEQEAENEENAPAANTPAPAPAANTPAPAENTPAPAPEPAPTPEPAPAPAENAGE